MKLINRVQELNKDELVYIGSKSAYFFIGYPKDFIENESELSKQWLQRFTNSYAKVLEKFDTHQDMKPKIGKSAIQKIVNIKTHKTEEVEIPYDKLNDVWTKKNNDLMKSIQSLQKTISKFVPIGDRNVKEEYRRMDNTGTVLIVSGKEVGSMWFYSDNHKTTIYEYDEDEEE